ncbi:MAG TPA: hypothetical protein VN704_11550 [Verrucomicrobiae bacterium]|nr:hypothetical protein [Verrucomicrobiae bacterium]
MPMILKILLRFSKIEEIKRRKSLYRNSNKEEYDIENKIVIIVDDGAATGATLIAASI